MSKKLNILVAYPYLSSQIVDRLRDVGPDLRLVVDSGAFTAWKAGKPINLDDYCRFLDGLQIKPWRYFTLDVVGDPHASMVNYETMLRRGYTPVPIFTRGEDPSVLDDYYKTSDVVGIGGLVQTEGNKGFVKGIMQKVAGRRVHWLGFTNPEFIKAFRPYMVDSSSWESGALYGNVRIYLGGGRFRPITRADFITRPDVALMDGVRALGVDPFSLSRDDAWAGSYSVIRTLCARSAVRLSIDIERHVGTKMFMATPGQTGMNLLCSSFDYFNQGDKA
jgi:hypothetical protein